MTWWPLLFSEAQAQTLEYLIERQGDYTLRPTAAQIVDAALALAYPDDMATDEQLDIMIEALRSKLQ